MSNREKILEEFIIEVLFHEDHSRKSILEFIQSDIRTAKQNLKSSTTEKAKQTSGPKNAKDEKSNLIKTDAASPTEKDEDEDDKKQGVASTNQQIQALEQIDAIFTKSMVQPGAGLTTKIRAWYGMAPTDKSMEMRKVGAAVSRKMKTQMTNNFNDLNKQLRGDTLSAKVTLMGIIADMLKDLKG